MAPGKRKFSNLYKANEIVRILKKPKPSSRIPRVLRNSLLTETHYVETYIQDTSVTTTAVLQSLNQIAQGDQTINRQGNQVLSKYLQYNFQVKSTSTAPTNYVVYIVLDRQSNASNPLISDILDTSTINVIWAMKNIRAYQDRFKILRCHRGAAFLASGGPTVTNGTNDGSIVQGYIDFTKMPAQDRVVRFPGTTAQVPNTNSIILVYMCDNATVSVTSLFGGFRYSFDEN